MIKSLCNVLTIYISFSSEEIWLTEKYLYLDYSCANDFLSGDAAVFPDVCNWPAE